MDIKELQDYRLSDAVKFHNHLNPKIWGRDEHLLPEVREKLMAIAEDFKEFLGLDLEVKDITISGSNATYTYSDHSDIDLHLVADLPKADSSELYRELFDAKKYQYNDQHNFKIGGYDVELYVQNANEPPNSQGIYSVLNNDWIKVPARRKATVNDESVRSKYEDIGQRIDAAIASGDPARLDAISKKVKEMRQAGLDTTGEFGPENLAFKVLRSNGTLEKLRNARLAAKDRQLSIDEESKPKKKFKYGYGQHWTPGFDYAKEAGESVTESKQLNLADTINMFAEFCAERLQLKDIPVIKLKKDPEWSKRNSTFGRFIPETNTMILSVAGRHPVDIMRTLAHELVHRKQEERAPMPADAGDTGSKWENEANAEAGVLMRDFGERNPEYFAKEINESSGYIPVNDKEARDPRWSMALTKDIRPGENKRQAAKMGWKTNLAGVPPTARTNGLIESLTRKLQSVKEGIGFPLVSEEEELDEVAMSPGALKSFANSPAAQGMQAGFEAELIFSGLGEAEEYESEWEPDYDYDTRPGNIEEIIDFFQNGDYADLSDRQADRVRDEMFNDYMEWNDEKMIDDWAIDQDEYVLNWIRENENEEEELSEEEMEAKRDEAIRDQNGTYEYALDEYRDNWSGGDESDWLRSVGIRYMTDAANRYDLMWPYMQDVGTGGDEGGFSEENAQRLADNLEEELGVKATVSGGYHSAKRDTSTWIFEPDSSLEGNSSDDMPVEIVSPPMPLTKTLEMMPKFFAWAEENGAYANKSTGFHMSVSMPDHAAGELDYTKLALFLGDEYVLQQFGRAANSYAKAAIQKIRERKGAINPEAVLKAMRTQLNQIATQALATPSGFGKYTSINPKENYIEFRSAGGSDYFRDMDKIQNTLMRYARATSIAMDPKADKQEYAKKLYKLLTDTSTYQVTDPKTGTQRTMAKSKVDSDVISMFSRYVAGELPKAALKSFIKVLQHGREAAKRGEAVMKRWKVTNTASTQNKSVEVVAANEQEAREKGCEAMGYPVTRGNLHPLSVELLDQNIPGTSLPSQTDAENRLGWPDQTGDANYEIVNRSNGSPVFKIIAMTDMDAYRKFKQWLEVVGLPQDTEDFGVRNINDHTRSSYQQTQQQPQTQQPQQVRAANGVPMWEIYNRTTGDVLVRFADHDQQSAWYQAQDILRNANMSDRMSQFSVRPQAT